MKTVTVLSFIFCALLTKAQVSFKQIKSPSISFQNTISPDESIEPIIYNDYSSPLSDTKQGRDSLIKQAFQKAMSLSVSCYPGVLTGVLLQLNPRTYNLGDGSITALAPGVIEIRKGNSPITFSSDGKIRVAVNEALNGYEKFFYLKGSYSGPSDRQVFLRLQVEYVEVQRIKNTYSEIVIDNTKSTWPYAGCFNFNTNTYSCVENNGDQCYCTSLDQTRQSIRVHANDQSQVINAKIYIYPLAFNSESYYMPTEKNTKYLDNKEKYGEWSRKLTHTLLYCILHEISHLEYYISKNCIIKFDSSSQSNEEANCNSYASSILKCVNN